MTEDRSPRLELHTFGGIKLGPDDVVDAAPLLSQDKRLGVLLYLALARPRGFHRRDVLLGLFWPELSPDRARHALNQTVYFIRQTLGNDVVIGRGTELGLDFDRWWIDAEAFREALDQGNPAGAIDLYRRGLYAVRLEKGEHSLSRQSPENGLITLKTRYGAQSGHCRAAALKQPARRGGDRIAVDRIDFFDNFIGRHGTSVDMHVACDLLAAR